LYGELTILVEPESSAVAASCFLFHESSADNAMPLHVYTGNNCVLNFPLAVLAVAQLEFTMSASEDYADTNVYDDVNANSSSYSGAAAVAGKEGYSLNANSSYGIVQPDSGAAPVTGKEGYSLNANSSNGIVQPDSGAATVAGN
jgi:hypothetical protein